MKVEYVESNLYKSQVAAAEGKIRAGEFEVHRCGSPVESGECLYNNPDCVIVTQAKSNCIIQQGEPQ